MFFSPLKVMNKKTIVSICIIIIIILVVIIDERINKEKDDNYIVNGENFKDFTWQEKYGNYFNKNKYKNYFVKPPDGINWGRG